MVTYPCIAVDVTGPSQRCCRTSGDDVISVHDVRVDVCVVHEFDELW
jgi:hypothetical protein